MDLVYVKVISGVVLFAVTIFAMMLPLLFFRNPRTAEEVNRRVVNLRLISFLSCFGAGVFLATCLLHLFPEVEELMDEIFTEVDIIPNYPVSEFLFGFGFLAILIIEQIVLNHNEPIEEMDSDRVPIITQAETASTTQSTESTGLNPGFIPPTYGAINNTGSLDNDVVIVSDVAPNSIFRNLLLVFALSLHSIFEGLAIGLQTSTKSDIRILIAVLIHKSVIAFTLGMKLSQSGMSVANVIKSNLFFSVSSPLGIFIGTVVMGFVSGLPMKITSGILQGIAAGTFLYITVFEILPQELKSGMDRLVKMGCVVVGYSVVSILLTFLPD